MAEKSGYLKKQGHQVKNWKTRFFVIKGDKILYYTNEQLTTLKGTINLADCYEANDDPRRGPKNFVIRTKENRSYFIEADNETEKNSWLSCIQKAGAAIFAKRTNSIPEENEDGDLSQEGAGTSEDKSDAMTIYLSADCSLFKWIQAEQNWETVDEFAKLVLIHHEDQSRYRIACYSNDCRYLLNSWYKSLAVSSMPKQPECAQLEVANGETTEFWGIRFCSEAHSKTFAEVVGEINSNGSLSKGFVPIDLRSPENEEYDEKGKAGKNSGNTADFSIAPLTSLFGAKKKNSFPAHVISVIQSLSQSLQKQTIDLLKGFLDLEGHTVESSHVVLDNIPIALEKTRDCIHCSTFLSDLIEKTREMYKSPSLRAGTANFDQNAFLAASGMAKFGVISDLNYKISEELGRIKSLAYQISVTLQHLTSCDIKETSTSQVLMLITIQSLNFLQSMDRLLSSVVTLKFIQSANFSMGEESNPPPQETPKEEKKTKDKPEEGGAASSIPSAGTLEQLIVRLTPDRAPLDMTYRNTFIRTYRSFAAPWELLDALKQRYDADESDDTKKRSIQLRVAGVIKYWIETNLNDFDDNLIEVLLDFIKNTMAKDGHAKTAEGLEKYLLRKQEERKQQAMATVKELSVMDIPMPEFGINIIDLILETKTHIIAEQLTLIDCHYYYKIETSELLNESWMKPKLKHRAPHVLGVIGRSTSLAFWVATLIQLSDNPTVRAKIMTKMIKVAKCLLKFNNFNTMSGIIAGLTMNPIFRLKNTFSRVPEKHKQAFAECQDLMNPQSSYKNHRTRVTTSKRPLLPYLGIVLTDLTMVETGTRDYTADGLINFRKREQLSQLIYDTTSFIDIKYQFTKVEPIYTLLRELPHLDNDDLYNLSLDIEPRDPNK